MKADMGGKYGERRFFLKDTIRQQVDFSRTGQNRGVAPPPMQKPVPETAERVGLPGGAAALARMPVREDDREAAEEILRQFESDFDGLREY